MTNEVSSTEAGRRDVLPNWEQTSGFYNTLIRPLSIMGGRNLASNFTEEEVKPIGLNEYQSSPSTQGSQSADKAKPLRVVTPFTIATALMRKYRG